ncbi:hypothetical protein B7494_g8180 [Chlorociboria aeruginascens]|nr:hypothetical protein B7494_g8180 [Chlorociboria aeruginascens]
MVRRNPAYAPTQRTNGRGMDHMGVRPPQYRRAMGQPAGNAYNNHGNFIPDPVPAIRQDYGWLSWPELTIRMKGLHHSMTTLDLWSTFSSFGTPVLIELFEDNQGVSEGKAKIRFSPAPSHPFWATGTFNIVSMDGKHKCAVEIWLEKSRRSFKIQSPIKKSIWYPEKMTIHPQYLNFGHMLDPNSMMVMYELDANLGPMSFTVDLIRNRLLTNFKIPIIDPRSQGPTDFTDNDPIGHYDRVNRYMFTIPFGQLETIYRVDQGDGWYSLIITLDSPPQFFRKREEVEETHSNETRLWTDFDTWYRQTDIVYNPLRLHKAPIALHKERPLIDIGRWTTYQLMFREDEEHNQMYELLKQALQDHNIPIVELEGFKQLNAESAELWSLIDPPIQQSTELSYLEDSNVVMHLPFEVRYQLEVCISRGILHEHNVTKEFVTQLAEIASANSSKARFILEYITEQDKRVYNPMSIFEDQEALAYSPKTEIPHYCAFSRKATITPSTILFSSPTVETTNRVLRYYARENKDGRFLRVQFTDEAFEGRINSCANKQRNDELYTRVYRTLYNGIRIGDRKYEFLAFGNSQFRENGAYFFCPTDYLSCSDIRSWMGNFTHINVVAKYAARLGQCFSTTRAINGLSKPDIVKIPDVERNNFCFTDGVGKISPFLAQMIAAELGLRSNAAPSAFQFRLGGCKGILVVSPDAKEKEVHIRKSQQKFIAVYNGLEIIRCARFSCATLNRQTITILSSLGVPDEIFLDMLSEQLTNYQNAMKDDTLALSLLSRYIDDNHMTINIASMILNGFMAERDPFVLSLLHLWRSWSIKLLKEKAKIIVENGAFLLGCVDETATLRGYTTPVEGAPLTADELPQIFLQVPDKNEPNQYNVIEGICLVGRNPSLHPGDLRVVEAVNVPALHHLRDLVVFPQKGERDVPSMCSGGDLDGDDFFVIWDKDLQPPETNCAPMNYDPPQPRILDRPVQVDDLMKFFVRFMKNDSLPTIAHAHLAQSDFLQRGIKDEKCLKLAQLHSMAVDYVKTGLAAEMPKKLAPTKWPHFMEKKHKPKEAQYRSQKILGKLYDKVESIEFVPQYDEPFDKRVLQAYKPDDVLLRTVRQIKSQYDTAMRRIMAQQEIRTEFEVWSTFVLSRPKVGSDYKVQEEVGIITGALKDRFRTVCINKAGSKDFSVLGPFVAAMYRVTKEELDIALAECHSTRLVAGKEVPKRKMEPKFMPLISFPWLFEKELGRIATGIDASDDMDDLGMLQLILKTDGSRKRQTGVVPEEEDYIRQENGVIVHRGEELDLFRPDVDMEGYTDDSDWEEGREYSEGHRFTRGRDGEVILATALKVDEDEPAPSTEQVSGTGVEDVVPRAHMDGFIHRETSLPTYTSAKATGMSLDRGKLPAAVPRQTPTESLIDVDDTPVETPIDPPFISRDRIPPSSLADLSPLNEPFPSTGSDSEEAEEVAVDLDVEESSLERLARLVKS